LDRIEGLAESFRASRVLLLTTYSEDGEHTRPMTNYGDDPYATMWFPTDAGTQKVRDIRGNPNAAVSFPATERGAFYVVEGEAYMATSGEVRDRWVWWWLFWHPHLEETYYRPTGDEYYAEKAIVMFKPLRARLVRGDEVEMLLKKARL